MQLQIGKKYETENGIRVEVVCTNYRETPDGSEKCLVVLRKQGRDIVLAYNQDGTIDLGGKISHLKEIAECEWGFPYYENPERMKKERGSIKMTNNDDKEYIVYHLQGGGTRVKGYNFACATANEIAKGLPNGRNVYIAQIVATYTSRTEADYKLVL